MKRLKSAINATIYSVSELKSEDAQLRNAAISAAKRAYAPYSKYKVGAAVLLQNGEIVDGNNQENVAYPSGLCAERVALFYAGAKYPDVPVVALAVAAIKGGKVTKSSSPCGACRQVILETQQRGGKNIRILMCGKDDTLVVNSAEDLLPFGFDSF